VTIRQLAVPALVVACLVSGCSSTVPPSSSPSPIARTAAPAPTPSLPTAEHAPRSSRDLSARVQGENVSTQALRISRRGRTYRSTSLRVVPRERGHRSLYVVVRTRTGAEPTYQAMRSRDAYAAVSATPIGAPDLGSCSTLVGDVDLCAGQRPAVLSWTDDAGASWQGRASALDGLLLSPLDSVAPDVLAVMGGGDGATLFPFESFERSTDAGETWSSGSFPLFDGQRAYSSGGAVLRDGRLLTVLGHFADDRPLERADRPRGLYVSHGADWTRMSPHPATFDPPVPHPGGYSSIETVGASASPDPVVWVETMDGTVYVSTDDGATFTGLALDGPGARRR